MNEPDIYREWAPPPGWGHTVACCWEQRVSSERLQRVPSRRSRRPADLRLRGDRGRRALRRGLTPGPPAGTHLQGIRFHPAAVAAAFRTPASSLRNRSVPADSVLGSRQARSLADRQRINAWIRSIEPSSRTFAAVDLLATRPVDDVAAELDVTGRHLRRIVLAEVGLAPKVYQQVVRLQRFIRAIDAGAPLAAAAMTAGYADQPHLTRAVRRFSALTPADLARERRSA